MKSRRSINSYIRTWILGFAFASLALSGLFLAKYVNDEVERHLRLAQGLIQLYSDDTISIELGRKNLVYVDDSLRRLNQLLKADRARILTRDGTVAQSTAPLEIGQRSNGLENGLTAITAAVREYSSGEPLGTIEVLINKNALVSRALQKALIPAFTLLLALLFLSHLAIRSLRNRLVRPITQLLQSTPSPTSETAPWPTEIHDLSVRLQEALNQRDLAMVGQFSSGIIHDLKTSLHSLRTGVELAQESTPDSPRRKQCLELLLKSAAHHVPAMESLVATTLDGTRSIPIHAQRTDLKNTIQTSIENHSEMLKRHAVNLELQVDSLPSSVLHDPLQMERVFSNIIKNAIEAASESPSASPKYISIRSIRKTDSVSILVEDSGRGLKTDPAVLLKSVKSDKVHGSGLGLWVSRKIIEAHQGALVAGKSETLSGARFEITLPSSEEVAT